MSNTPNPPTELERLYAANAAGYVFTIVLIVAMLTEVVARGTWLIVPVTLIALTFLWYVLALRWRIYRKNQRLLVKNREE